MTLELQTSAEVSRVRPAGDLMKVLAGVILLGIILFALPTVLTALGIMPSS